MKTNLPLATWTSALSKMNSPVRQQTMRTLVRAELSSALGAALKLGVAMLVFEGMIWLAAWSAPAAPGAAVAVTATQPGKRNVAGLAECTPLQAARGLCNTPVAQRPLKLKLTRCLSLPGANGH